MLQRRIGMTMLAMLLTMVFSCAALAAGVRLHNKDAKAYKLYVKHSGSAVHTSINARAVTNICSGACTIKVVQTGSVVNARPGDRLVIQGGKLSRRGK